jgi:hypothetical protein
MGPANATDSSAVGWQALGVLKSAALGGLLICELASMGTNLVPIFGLSSGKK